MPFINSKVSVQITPEQETQLKARLGQAISLIPGKSEQWLMTGFQDNYHLYFRGDKSDPIAFIEVQIYGTPSASSMDQLTSHRRCGQKPGPESGTRRRPAPPWHVFSPLCRILLADILVSRIL